MLGGCTVFELPYISFALDASNFIIGASPLPLSVNLILPLERSVQSAPVVTVVL